jgi:DUF438 domain-containing protein
MDDKLRLQKLSEVFYAIYHGKYGQQIIRQNQAWLDQAKPTDVIRLVDMLVQNNVPMAGLKTGISKFINLIHKTLLSNEIQTPVPDSLLDFCIRNNSELDSLLKTMRPLLKTLNDDPNDLKCREELLKKFTVLENYGNYYRIKENVLFPLLEKQWKEYRCLKVMWALHDDIRNKLHQVVDLLSGETMDMTRLNRLAGDIFFHMYAIRFREERILFPVIMDTIPDELLNGLLPECAGIGFPFVNPKIPEEMLVQKSSFENGMVDLQSGKLTPEQIILIFNHLPVDITYVDENDQVKFFSAPPDRIFTRTQAALNRDVRNCHPPESLHVVEEILEAFRKGERDSATFWIDIQGEKVLIQYFACRDGKGSYKGVVEVTQVISGIQSLSGEKRLLDWKR